MNIGIFIISIFVICLLLIALNFDNIYNYYTYVSPINNVKILNAPLPHPDNFKIHDNLDHHNLDHHTMHRMKYIAENDTITVIFGGGKKLSENTSAMHNFSYTQNFHRNQTFVFNCVERDDHTLLWFYKYIGVRNVFQEPSIVLWHYEGETHQNVPCNYPEIIIHSIDLVDHDHSKKFPEWEARLDMNQVP